MTKYLSLIVLLTLLCPVISCNQNDGEHLPPAKMEQIMFDIGIAEAYSTKSRDNTNFGGVKNMDSLAAYYTDILAHYKVTPAQFRQSLNWYKNHTDDMDSLYTHLTIKADQATAEESRKKKLSQPVAPTTQVPAQTITPAPSATIKPKSSSAVKM